jgi:uncharacterized protein (DUF4415 family)
MNGNRQDTPDNWVDPDDAPELTGDFFEHANLFEGEKLIRRGRPRLDTPKEHVTLRLSQEVTHSFRETGEGWQTRINAALTDWLKTHSPADLVR